VKSDGAREAFDRGKIEQSVTLACRKRGIPQERLDQLVSGIQRQIETLGESEVTSKTIGEMVMDGLRQLDSVAYIRFASVYRDFSEQCKMPPSSNQPAIVLVRPQLGENIGKAARAMLNFGLTDLRLVAPRDGWPNPSAGPAAAGADLVLEQARIYDSLADAVADSMPPPCASAG